jgi:hypothetical protein
VEVTFNSTNRTVKITDCLYVPEIGVNLISIRLLDQKGLMADFKGGEARILAKGKPITIGYYQNQLPTFQTTSVKEQIMLVKEDPKIWHKRLAHLG